MSHHDESTWAAGPKPPFPPPEGAPPVAPPPVAPPPYPAQPYPAQPYPAQPYPAQPYPAQSSGQLPGYPPPAPWQQPPPPTRGKRPVVVLVAAVVLALALIGGAVALTVLGGDDDEPGERAGDGSSDSTGDLTGDPTGDPTDGSTGEATLDDVQIYSDLEPRHELGPLSYPQTPPVGGHHNPMWLDCGVYSEPVPNENAVHDLEHGTVWITYDPAVVDEAGVATLAAQLPANGILSPYPGIPAPVVLTVWERQLAVTGPDDPRIAMFIDEFQGGETSPEPFASCIGGIQPEDSDVSA